LSTSVSTSPPYQFSITIPGNTKPGLYRLTASGATGPGTGSESPAVTIRVENPNQLIELKSDLAQIVFQFVGQQIPLVVMGTFSDATKANISDSLGTTYQSNNPSVVMVNTTGLVTAIGGGYADVIVRYGAQSLDIPVSVPQTIAGDLNGDHKVDQDDLNILFDFLNAPATGSFDARDLNHDSKIDSLDVTELIKLCTGCCPPPVISNASANPAMLWPPDHNMVPVTINYTNTGSCQATCILTVSSNEPVLGTGDGDKSPDWQVLDASHLLLRAERGGAGQGRVYTITYQVSDACGNMTEQSATVSVPLSLGR